MISPRKLVTDHKIRNKFLLIILVVAIFLTFGSGAFALSQHKSELTTQIYDRNGQLIYEIYGDQNRIYVPIGKIPRNLRNATIAEEDKNFYKHPGIDPIAIIRAAKATIFDKDLQGGSTITQQYVRNAYLSQERTYKRKLKEIVLALYVEKFTPKDKILEKYLNEVSYGGVNYGVETAAHFYFNKDVSQLNLEESAFLASLPQSPSNFADGKIDQERAKKRVKAVLEKMQKQKMITQQEKEESGSHNLNFTYTSTAFEAPHFAFYIRKQLEAQFGKDAVEKGGLQVNTTLDLTTQKDVQEIVKNEVTNLKGLNVGNGASIIVNPKSGEILALVGSKDFFDTKEGNYDLITQAIRQPGSSIKPIMYATAFEKGYTPATVVFDYPTVFYNQWEKYAPVNYDGKFHGPVSIRTALGNSYNIPAIRMLATIGVDDFITRAHDMGITTLEKNGMGLSLTVGGGGVRLIEMAQGYQVLANQGVKNEIYGISQVANQEGKVIYEHKESNQKVLDSGVTYLLADILSDNQARSWAFGPNSLLKIDNHQVAVKTGTSDDKRDNWAIGYNPDYLVLSWVGNNDNSPMNPALSSGITGATPIWHNITANLLKNQPQKWYEKPQNIIQKDVDISSGKLACKSTYKRNELFVAGTEPKGCASYQRVLVEKQPDGKENIVRELQKDENLQPDNDKMEVKFIAAIKDPLMEKTGSRDMIKIS